MLPTKFFEICKEEEICRLRGCPKRGEKYFVVVSEENKIVQVLHARLRNNLRSQRSPSYPAGYLPFRIIGVEWNYNIQTSAFETRRLFVTQLGKPSVRTVLHRRHAAILKSPPKGSELFLLLKQEDGRTRLEEKLRRAAALSMENLEVAGELLQEEVLGCSPSGFGVATVDPAERFEFYLGRAKRETLEQLLSLLCKADKEPAPAAGPADPGSLQAYPRRNVAVG